MALAPVDGAIEPSPGDTSLAPAEEPQDTQLATARRLLRKFRAQRAGWLGHLRSFIGVNLGLAGINVLTAIADASFYPWFLYVTASWGIGLLIHGLNYRGWVRDKERSIEQAEAIVGASRYEDDLMLLPPAAKDQDETPALGASAEEEAPALPAGEGEPETDEWSGLIASCREAVDEANRALDEAELEEEVSAATRDQLAQGLRTVEVVQRGARAIGEAIRAVAPKGSDSLNGELSALRARIDAASDERLKGVYEANLSLLEARRKKLDALMAEEERMRATVDGFLLAAQNVRLDAARLGAGHVPGRLSDLGDSLERLDQEVEVVRQVEAELDTL